MATQKKFIADLGLETASDLSVDGNATITGNLTVNGSTITVNSTTTSVADSLRICKCKYHFRYTGYRFLWKL